MTPFVTDSARQIADSGFQDALSRGIDWVVIGLVLALLAQHEWARLSSRGETETRSRMTWLYVGPLIIAIVSLFAQRLANTR